MIPIHEQIKLIAKSTKIVLCSCRQNFRMTPISIHFVLFNLIQFARLRCHVTLHNKLYCDLCLHYKTRLSAFVVIMLVLHSIVILNHPLPCRTHQLPTGLCCRFCLPPRPFPISDYILAPVCLALPCQKHNGRKIRSDTYNTVDVENIVRRTESQSQKDCRKIRNRFSLALIPYTVLFLLPL